MFFLNSINQEPKIKKGTNKLYEFHYVQSSENIFHQNYEIKKSSLFVFFLTDDYIESELFKTDCEYAKSLNKLTLFELIN